VKKTALFLSLDAYRTRKTRVEEVLRGYGMSGEVALDAEDVLPSGERLDRLTECVARLDDKTRAIFLACRLEGLSYQEIGRRHQVSTRRVEKHIAKALLLITTWMEGWQP